MSSFHARTNRIFLTASLFLIAMTGRGWTCESDADCDDGVFCNGAEVCVGNVCMEGAAPCDALDCNEGLQECTGSACCFTSGDVCFDDVVAAECTGAGGTPLGMGRTCDGDEDFDGVVGCDDLCPGTGLGLPVDEDGCSLLGACCFQGFFCIDDADPSDCFLVGGDYQGNGTVCDDRCVLPCLAQRTSTPAT